MKNRIITFTKHFAVSVALLILGVAGAQAASSDWTSTKGGKLRLVALPPEADGSIYGFVEIAPEAGWHTYWKVPGSGGIPPQITLKEGGNAILAALDFPAPRIFEDGNLRDFGYDGRVMLPITLKQKEPGKPSTIDASIFIGLCADICVPFQAEVSVSVGPQDVAKPAEKALVSAANAALPEAPGADFAVVESRPTPDATGVVMKIKLPPAADPATAEFIVIGPDGQPYGKPKFIASEAGTVAIEARPLGGSGPPVAGKQLDVLAFAMGRAMETTVAIN
jgi:DsbC/DsbD-like thiol-disulfide interchange protein